MSPMSGAGGGMSSGDPFGAWDEQSWDDAIQAYTEGLDGGSDGLEMKALIDRAGGENLQRLEEVIASIQWTHLDSKLEAPPVELSERMQTQAQAWLASDGERTASRAATPMPTIDRPRTPWVAVAGWAAAAALLVVLFSRGLNRPTSLSPEDQMVAFLEIVPDLTRIDWTATEDALALGASGEVLWSDERQEGYMVFRGLKPNDSKLNQYQLWMFDPSRADWEAKPVDGGVFDILPGGEIVVPIDAKLRVQNVALFAITLEVPGGVVVSEREHLLLTAAKSS